MPYIQPFISLYSYFHKCKVRISVSVSKKIDFEKTIRLVPFLFFFPCSDLTWKMSYNSLQNRSVKHLDKSPLLQRSPAQEDRLEPVSPTFLYFPNDFYSSNFRIFWKKITSLTGENSEGNIIKQYISNEWVQLYGNFKSLFLQFLK